MKKIFFIFLTAFYANSGQGQNVNFEWATSVGGSADDQGFSVALDKKGNVYTTGYFTGRVDFDPGKDTFFLTSFAGSKDIFVSKQDDKGKFIWAVKMGGTGSDQGNGIALDTSGNIVLTGSFQLKSDFDPDTGSAVLTAGGRSDIFVCKLDGSGALVWAKDIGGKGEDVSNAVAVSPSGNIYTTGSFDDTMTYTVSSSKGILVPYGGLDIFICRMDASGSIGWINKMGSTTDDAGFAITLDKSESIHATGYFTGKSFFITGSTTTGFLTSFGDADVYVLKMDAKGGFTWVRQLGGRNYERGNGIVLDGSGNVYTTGVFNGTGDFDPAKGTANLNSNGGADIFVSKLDGSGVYVWAKQIGSTYDDGGFAITLDGSSNVYTTGGFQDRADFDPGTSTTYNLTSSGSDDVFILKLNSSGAFLWAKNMGGGKSDMGFSVAVNSAKDVYSAGSFTYRCDFDPGKDTFVLASKGSMDVFVNKMALCSPSSATINAGNCYSYNFYGNTYDVSGTYYHVIPNAKGCDSTITLNLTIYTTTFNYMQVLACKSYTLNGQVYTTAGVYNQIEVNSHGCDSVIVLDLTFGESSDAITRIACDSYSLNGKTYNKSGIYTQTHKNKAGCDSTLTLKLTIKKSSASNLIVTACDSFSIVGRTFTSSGVYVLVTKNNSDCDSTITLNLTINKSSASILNKSVCASYSLNGKTYTTRGVYKQTIKNKMDCDSFITLNLEVNNTAEVITKTACKSYKLNDQVYTSSGAYNQIIPNAKGCDSSITLNLTINKANVAVTQVGAVLGAVANNAAYQWLDCNKNYTPLPGEIYQYILVKNSGNYAVKVTENSCTDTSVCLNVNFNSVQNQLPGMIKVWPNPGKGEINIETGSRLDQGTIKVFNTLGEMLVQRSNLSGDSFRLNISELSKGFYFLEISENGKATKVKLVKD